MWLGENKSILTNNDRGNKQIIVLLKIYTSIQVSYVYTDLKMSRS